MLAVARSSVPARFRFFGSSVRPMVSARAFSTTEPPTPTHPAFQIIGDRHVKEYDIRVIEYEHSKSGAKVLSLIAPDDNKVFGITFRTPPADSTGLPHVLEHSVFCGSRKYPTKEPFVHLLKGSLNTFLNAMTYPDRTCYPVASMNLKDFYNLVDVYMDAVFYPRAVKDPRVLAQEGWHYAMENETDVLQYKGVVYNEMKGVYSSPEAVMGRFTQQALFPDTAYGYDSGGDPEKIPLMTFESLSKFHSTYYHPSNSRIFFYGDDDPSKRLNLLDEYLKDFDKIHVHDLSSLKFQKPFKSSQNIESVYPTAVPDEKKHMMLMSWVLNDRPLHRKDKLGLAVLSHLLFATSDSIMRKTLTESLLGDGVIVDYSDELLQSTLEVGMRGVLPENTAALKELIIETFTKLAEQGFESTAVKASLNTIEFNLREFNTGGYPKGLSIMLGIMPNWIHDMDPVELLEFELPLSELKAEIAAGVPVFQNLIRNYVLNNQHSVVVNMKPDPDFENRRQAAEESRLASIRDRMNANELASVVLATQELLDAQSAEDPPEAKASLPRHELDDISKRNVEIPVTIEDLPGATLASIKGRVDNSKLLCHVLPTSGILYANVAINISGLPFEFYF